MNAAPAGREEPNVTETPTPTRDIKFCPGCASSVKPGAKFCPQCGFELVTLASKRSAGATVAVVVAAALFVGGTVLLATRLKGPGAAGGEAPRGPADVMKQAATQGQGVASTAAGPGAMQNVDKAQIENALEPLRDRVVAEPDSIDAKLRLGFGVYRASSLLPEYATEAEKIFREILAKDPENLDAAVSLANVYYDLERPADAIPLYETFLAKHPEEASVRTDLATMYLYTKRTAAAIREYQKVIAEKPDFVNAYYNLGNAYHASGDTQKALETYRKAQALNPQGEIAQAIENVVAKLEGRQPKMIPQAVGPDGLPPGHPPLGEGADGGAPGGAAEVALSSGPQGEVEAVFKNHPIVGPRVSRFEWDHDTQLKVWVRDFPMKQMPEGVRTVFMTKIGASLAELHKKAGNADPYRAEIVDEATGEVMATTEG